MWFLWRREVKQKVWREKLSNVSWFWVRTQEVLWHFHSWIFNLTKKKKLWSQTGNFLKLLLISTARFHHLNLLECSQQSSTFLHFYLRHSSSNRFCLTFHSAHRRKALKKFMKYLWTLEKRFHLSHVYLFGHRLDFIHYPNESTEHTQWDYFSWTITTTSFHE